MKKVRLPDGQEIQLPSSMSDLDVQRVVKLLMDKLGKLQAYEKGKEVVLINTELPKFPEFPQFPEFPKLPEGKDYTKIFKDFVNEQKTHNKNVLEETKALNKSVAYLSGQIERQTNEITQALNMQNEVLAELVVAYREPKKITRDDMGRPEGIE
tara:strand:+ start:440 stop:901 length:462 start_codon:yes stop_codon:yes gene_type:complete